MTDRGLQDADPSAGTPKAAEAPEAPSGPAPEPGPAAPAEEGSRARRGVDRLSALLTGRRPRISGELVAALSDAVPDDVFVRWSGIVTLTGKGVGAMAVTPAGLALAVEHDGGVSASYIAGADIRWVGEQRGRTVVAIGDGEELVFKRPDPLFFTALLAMSKTKEIAPKVAGATPSPPAIGRSAPPAPVPAPAPDRRAAPVADRRAHTRALRTSPHPGADASPGGELAPPAAPAPAPAQQRLARVITPFVPTAYLRHDDGALRPAAWSAGPQPSPEPGCLVAVETDGAARWLAFPAVATAAPGAGEEGS